MNQYTSTYKLPSLVYSVIVVQNGLICLVIMRTKKADSEVSDVLEQALANLAYPLCFLICELIFIETQA